MRMRHLGQIGQSFKLGHEFVQGFFKGHFAVKSHILETGPFDLSGSLESIQAIILVEYLSKICHSS